MVGLVIVSHSYKIAEGVVELCSQIASNEVSIVSAGGTSDGEIGTSPIKILNAIKEADTGDGVIIIYDLGSALMNAEMAVEMVAVEIEQNTNVIIAEAPIVEGSIVAAVEANIGTNIGEIITKLKDI
ncbi:dihydroxyacetone kinase phosphoryl donor subunit DhaM [Oceanirhabdus seepicola]|uniref:phosphoenolpyruvate--glycerone phosphotransferase n=1 Tax=Oceanirhabdus seepicola TaxID=2828781 RepID=A0A9J6P5Z8_9CLOT|nr:dihydroxyacetone kinase phosphoryl donor subunit DhaM [Oceanirhabdus seepicola]MCM1990904.1 PTS-dependent dihydroxyacetone kinase phosphotransferase subunit DhaM [Oceanirhabdus seepicola]